MCQLTKANSIEGSKKHAVDIVYTFADNLLKRSGMAEGQVGFKVDSQRKVVKNVNKDRELYNSMKKSKREEFPDLHQQHIDHMIIWEKKQQHKLLEKKWEEERIFKALEEAKRKEEEEKKARAQLFSDFMDKDVAVKDVKNPVFSTMKYTDEELKKKREVSKAINDELN